MTTATRTKPVPVFDDLIDRSYDPRAGFDCVGLVREVYRRLGWRFPWPVRHSDGAVDAQQLAELHRHWRPCAKQYGAVCVMETGDTLHIGVMLCCNRVLHCPSAPVGRVVYQRHERLQPLITGWYLPREHQREEAGD